MYCPNCGTHANDDARFCENCGTQLTGVDAQTVQIPLASDAQATQAVPAPQDQNAAAAKDQSNASAKPEPPMGNASGRPEPPTGSPVPPPPAGPPMTPPPSGEPVAQTQGDTAPLVLGILSIVFAGIVGLVLAIIGLVKSKKVLEIMPDSGKAKGGKICSIVGLVLSIIGFVVTVVAIVFALNSGVNLITIDMDPPSSHSTNASKPSSSSSGKSSSAPSTKSIPSKSSAATTSSTYENARFGYSLKVPAGFEKTAESANGDGATFYNSRLKMTVYVSGYNNANGLTPERIIETKWNGTPDTMSESDDAEALLYQIEGNDEVFYYWYVGAGSINELTIKYPKQDDNSDELDAAESLIMGFQVGSVASTH